MNLPRKLVTIDIALILITIFILLEVIFHGFLLSIDTSVNASIPIIYNNFSTIISKNIDTIFDTIPILILSMSISIILWYKHSRKEATFFATTMIADGAVLLIIKNLVHRARPLNKLIIPTDYAFPSGHAVTAVVFFGIITYLLLKNTQINKFKSIILTIYTILILLIGFSRIYLNVHWLSDVLGGLAIGGIILTTSIIFEQTIKIKFLEQ